MANPGIGITDYFAEHDSENPATKLFQDALNDSLALENDDASFLFLRRQFCWHGGFSYWQKKLNRILCLLAKRHFNDSYGSAMKDLAGNLALVQRFPYHSSSFPGGSLENKLPSAKLARDFFETSLRREAESGERIVIIARNASRWGVTFEDSKGSLYVYPGKLGASASLTEASVGGDAILKFYEKKFREH